MTPDAVAAVYRLKMNSQAQTNQDTLTPTTPKASGLPCGSPTVLDAPALATRDKPGLIGGTLVWLSGIDPAREDRWQPLTG
ncbi:hypothetical protein [Streptomyces acidicola]|uniref:Uncharacterized protein n=1 Tax=Streptomyces acidicola TaxID=2596892 RepID=A0A5N8WM53_9ACTN|nr:hypothetical protein [Streptomyces acidicola]MPY47604.1 hypothetical protein [Streptomyces acidicola]